MTALLPDRAWSTWDPRFPACVMHLPSRFAVRVTLFSATENRYDPCAAEHQLSFALGEHTLDGDYAALRVTSMGTTLQVRFARGEWSGVSGRVEIKEPGEMLFRLGILVEAGFLDRAGADTVAAGAGSGAAGAGSGALAFVTPDPGREHLQPAELRAGARDAHLHLAVSPVPALSTRYASPDGVREDLEHRGWLYHPPPTATGRWAAMRFYGDPRQVVRFAVARESDPVRAAVAARTRLAETDAVIDAAGERARRAGSEAARAVRDVMAWNTVWDADNARPYTAASRAWLRGFGGWGIWMSDAYYSALMCARAGDAWLSRVNLHAVMAGQQPAGNVPCLAAADETWVDRTQLPVAAFTVWRIWLITGERSLLADTYPVLCRQLRWQLRARDGNGNGLYEYGSSPTGHAQGAGTRQGALNESGMDNLAVFDDAVFVESAGTVDLEDPGHNSLIALELEMLGRIAATLGRAEEARRWERLSVALRERIATELWDPAREVFAARHWDGSFAAHIAPTSFFTLVAGAASPEQTDALLERWLLRPERFWGALPLPSAPLDDPVGLDDSYWRGRIWAPMLYWTWEGLHRSGRLAEAHELARRAWEMFAPEWTGRRHCHENYNARDPAGHEAHDSDPFYSWGALIPFMWESECADASPWEGLVLAPGGSVGWGGRRWSACDDGDGMAISLDGVVVETVAPAGRLTHVADRGTLP